jgi:branched-chain amino acid transport system ATP-binding protein
MHLTIAGKKRLELARALAARPLLLLLDEVLAGLNPSEVDHMIGVVRLIREYGVAILMIEHLMQAISGGQRLCLCHRRGSRLH